MSDFILDACINPNSDMVAEVRADLGRSWDEVYGSAESIADFARAVRAARGQAFCMLPFCHTVEAEAMGADVNLGDEVSVARAGTPVCTSMRDVLGMELSDERSHRLSRMIEAARMLSEAGEQVMYSISGPVSILSCLLDLRVVFREWRREPELVQEVLGHLRGQVIPYALRAADAGVTYMEYADPPASVSIVGPRVAITIAEGFTTPFIRELSARMVEGTSIFLCPMAATEKMRSLEGASVKVRCPKA